MAGVAGGGPRLLEEALERGEEGVSNHRLSTLAHANISSSDFARRSGRSATAITS
jgi:hypothetical protein